MQFLSGSARVADRRVGRPTVWPQVLLWCGGGPVVLSDRQRLHRDNRLTCIGVSQGASGSRSREARAPWSQLRARCATCWSTRSSAPRLLHLVAQHVGVSARSTQCCCPPRRSHSLRATPAPASGWIGSTSSCRRCFAASSAAAQHQTKGIFFISASVRLSLCPLQSA